MSTRQSIEQELHRSTRLESQSDFASGVQRDSEGWHRTDGWPPIRGGSGESNPPEADREEPRPEQDLSLFSFADRVSYVVTDLNGFISSIVNEEVDLSDFDDDLTELFDKLPELEKAVTELGDVFYA
jgi:hypothetical protein